MQPQVLPAHWVLTSAKDPGLQLELQVFTERRREGTTASFYSRQSQKILEQGHGCQVSETRLHPSDFPSSPHASSSEKTLTFGALADLSFATQAEEAMTDPTYSRSMVASLLQQNGRWAQANQHEIGSGEH